MIRNLISWIPLALLSTLLLSACTGNASITNTPVLIPEAPTATEVPVDILDTPTPPSPTALPASPTPVPDTPTPTMTATFTPTALPDGWHLYTIDKELSQASYTVEEEFFSRAVQNLGKKLGLFTTIGVTDEISGHLILDLNGIPMVVSGEIVADISLLKSDDRRRDDRIRDEFLESSRFPLAVFVPTEIENFSASSYQEGQEVTFDLAGELTIRKVTKTTPFEVTALLENGVLQGTATTTILMTDFGFDPPGIAGFMQAENEALITVKIFAAEQGG